MDKKVLMPITVDQLTRARNLAELIHSYEDLIAFYSNLKDSAVAHISLDFVAEAWLKSELQISRDIMLDMLGAQCDKYIYELEALGFSVED